MKPFKRSTDRSDRGGRRDSSRGRESGRSSGRDFDRRESGRFGGRDFDRRDSGRRSRGRDSGPLTMHKVTCDKCNKECEVPFKPTESKPVYCSDCFRKNGSGSGSNNSSKGLDEINKKLDKILGILEEL